MSVAALDSRDEIDEFLSWERPLQIEFLDGLSPIDFGDFEYLTCKRDRVYFVEHYGYIRDERTGTEFYPGIEMWPGVRGYAGQQDFAYLYAEGYDLCVLKARQLGFSWIAGNIDLSDVLFEENVRLGILDKKEPDAWKHIERIKMAYNKIAKEHPYLTQYKRAIVGHEKVSEFALSPYGTESDMSLIEAHVNTAAAARGMAVKRARLEEFAFYANAKDVLTGVGGSSADEGGQIVIISTGNKASGDGKVFHEMYWNKAVNPPDGLLNRRAA